MKRVFVAGAMLLVAACESSIEVSGEERQEAFETKHLTAAEYEEFIDIPGKLSVVMFHADWCGPCKVQGPVVEAVAEEFEGRVVFGKVDVDESADLARRLGVVGIPDLRIFRDGVMVDGMKGAVPKVQVRNHFSIQVSQLKEARTEVIPKEGSGQAVQPMKQGWLPPGVEAR